MNKVYRYADAHRRRPQFIPGFFNGRTESSGRRMLAWLGTRSLIFFVLVLLCLFLMSIACDLVFGAADLGVSDAGSAIQQGAEPAPADVNTVASQSAPPQSDSDHKSLLSWLVAGDAQHNGGSPDWISQVNTLAFRLTLAALLGAVVAFRPRRSVPPRLRNPLMVQTQILLTVVACALMIIVGDSAARAFGIFAAASMVRFRTSISDPKEITVLLSNLGIGLAAGVGRWELATMFALFVLLLLQILESYEDHQAFRSMELSVKTHDVAATDEAVREMFRRKNLCIDLREINKRSEKQPLGKVVYAVDIKHNLNTDRLAEEIYSADSINIDRIEWHCKKARSA